MSSGNTSVEVMGTAIKIQKNQGWWHMFLFLALRRQGWLISTLSFRQPGLYDEILSPNKQKIKSNTKPKLFHHSQFSLKVCGVESPPFTSNLISFPTPQHPCPLPSAVPILSPLFSLTWSSVCIHTTAATLTLSR